MRGHDFMWITEVENKNAHDVLEQTIHLLFSSQM